MKRKSFIVTFATLVITTGLLYFIGHRFTIPFLMFHHEYTADANGFFITTGSLVPVIMGLIFSYFAEKIYVYRHRQKRG
ncbi:hypothetical protein LJK88_44080 [Paenibacillus sp. P26]|nr:hypothetical protein LJK88_44080 [Paenibacillus sp. P26]UUZ92328.1 hypothetical protein LJK87_44245 [Paenibacillus sp. P25]